MKTLVVLLMAGVALAAMPVAAQQPPAGTHRIGFAAVSQSPAPEVIRKHLEGAGYVEGRNFVLEVRSAEGRQERLPDVIAELLRLNVDVLVCTSTATVLAAKTATTTVPIVFASVFDPVASGIVPALARPGGNVTGSAIGAGGSGAARKWIELLREVSPGIRHVALLWNSANPASAESMREVQAAARALNVKLDAFDTGTVANLDHAFAAIRAKGARGIVVTNDPFFTGQRARLIDFATDRRLPAVYFFDQFVDAGGLMSYGGSQAESFQRAAVLVDKILRGARPADLPIEQSTRIELVINQQAAHDIGLVIPNTLLLRADRVIPAKTTR